MKEPIFKATHIVKTFGPTIALNDVDIKVYPGEIRGFIGENGSGKSTMSQIMTGIYTRNSGTMIFKDEVWEPKSMMDALNRGIGIAVQENGTISGDSVSENIFLCELDKFSGVNYFEKERIVTFSKYFDLSLDVFDKLFSLYNESSKTNEDKKIYINKVKEETKKLLIELKSKKASYIAKENEIYNNKVDSLYVEVNNKLNVKLSEVKACDIDETKKNKIGKYRKSVLNKELKNKLKFIDLEHQNNLEAIVHDYHSVKNVGHNTILKIRGNESNVLTKAKDFFLKLVFGKLVNQNKMNRHAKKVLADIGVYHIRPELPMGAYDIQNRKLIEIAKVLAKNPEIFIVDETTTALSEDGRQILYKKMEDLKNEGKAVLFISHDLEEIMDKCDTLTVLRDGSIVADFVKEEFDAEKIKKAMIGRELKGDYYRADYDSTCGEKVLLRAENISLNNRLSNINLDLHEGEIVGIGGLSDCGMHDLGKVLFGAIHPSNGRVLTGDNLEIEVKNELTAMKNKIGYLPKDRDVEALALNDSIFNNIAIASINNITKLGIYVDKKAESDIVNEQVDFLQIKCNSSSDLVRKLSGGNKQKVALGKWLGNKSKILLLDCPTRGVDIGVKQFIYNLMNNLKHEGYAILMISEELPELIGMSDRLLIMRKGEISHEFKRSSDLKQEQIVNYML